MVAWYHSRYRRATAAVSRLDSEEIRTSVSIDEVRDCRKFRTIEETKLGEREITLRTAPSRIGCPLVSPPEKEPAGRLPRVLLPLKLIRSLYVYLLKFMRQFSCIMREILCITESVPKPSDVLLLAYFLKSEFDLFS